MSHEIDEIAAENIRTDFDSAPLTETPPNKHAEYIKGLRLLADHLEAHPDFPGRAWSPDIYFRVNTKEALIAAARTLGSFKKKVLRDSFYIIKKLGNIEVKVYTSRANVCTKIITGQRWEEGSPAEPAKEGKMVDVVQWDCPDTLLAKETADPNA